MTVAYGEEVLKSGVYEVLNTITGQRYIGSSYNLNKRLSQHRSKLKQGNHGNVRLRNSVNKYGYDIFITQVLEYCQEDKLIEREQFHIDHYNLRKDLYNTRKIADRNIGQIAWNEGTAGKGVMKPNKTSFKEGLVPWNKGLKGCNMGDNPKRFKYGQRVSIKTEFKTKGFSVLSPDRINYIGDNAKLFCIEFNLNNGNFYRLLKSKYLSDTYKGWRLPDPNITYKVINWEPKTKQESK